MTIDHDRRRVVVRAQGTITFDEVLAHLEQERGALGLTYPELIDARGSDLTLSSAQIRAIVDLLRYLATTSRLGPTAVVVDGDLSYGILRMLEVFVEDVAAIRPFRRPDEAEEWLMSHPTE